MRGAVILVLALLALGGCKRQDMYSQNASRTWDGNLVFRNGSSMRDPVAGTVALNAPDGVVPRPVTIDAALLARGQARFDIFCTPCHGRAGDGEGMIVQRGFPHPPSLTEGRVRAEKAELLYDTITHGHGAMYSYADRVSPADRWAIIAYIRALQLSQDADASRLPASDRARLEAAR